MLTNIFLVLMVIIDVWSLVAQMVKSLHAVQEEQVQFLGQ